MKGVQKESFQKFELNLYNIFGIMAQITKYHFCSLHHIPYSKALGCQWVCVCVYVFLCFLTLIQNGLT